MIKGSWPRPKPSQRPPPKPEEQTVIEKKYAELKAALEKLQKPK